MLGETGYTALSFEGKLPIFRGGRAPNLDVILADNERIVAVESKLAEHLAGGQLASFKPAYDAGIELADDSWRALYEWLKRTPDAFAYLDAGQLVRHYLGLKKQTASGRTHEGKTATLLYVYWEPTNASELPACRSHTAEIAAFGAAVSDPQLSFVATTYSALWNEWERAHKPPWLGRHVALLQQRYEFPL